MMRGYCSSLSLESACRDVFEPLHIMPNAHTKYATTELESPAVYHLTSGLFLGFMVYLRVGNWSCILGKKVLNLAASLN